MDDDKEPAIRITAPADADKWGGPRYVFKDKPLKLSILSCRRPLVTASG
jgi:hypothetical protein